MNRYGIRIVAVAMVLLTVVQSENAAVALETRLKTSVLVATAGESVELDGDVRIEATYAGAPDKTGTVEYSCRIAGTGSGSGTKASYVVTGSGSGRVPVGVAPPVDIGMECPLTVAYEDKVQQYVVNLQGTLDTEGNLSGLVVREVGSRPE